MEKLIKIMIVEDEILTALMIRGILEEMGYTISDMVSSGEKAVLSVKENPPDIVLMDIRLSGEMDGIVAAGIIMKDYQIPVIFITGYGKDEQRQRAMELNPVAYFSKPVSSFQLREVISKLFPDKP